MNSWPVPLDPAGVAAAVLAIAAGDEWGDATQLGVTGQGIKAI